MLSEYDFYRKDRPCSHEYFKFSRFIFHYKKKQIMIEYEEEEVYNFITPVQQNTFKQYQLLCKKAEARFEDAFSKALNGLKRLCKDLMLILSNKIIAEENVGKRQSWEVLREEVTQIIDQISGSEGSLKHIPDLSSPADIESSKRSLFIRICTLKIQIDSIKG